MVIFIRDKKHTINELNMFTCKSYSYLFGKNNVKVIIDKTYEKLDSNPEIFVFVLLIIINRKIGTIMVILLKNLNLDLNSYLIPLQ